MIRIEGERVYLRRPSREEYHALQRKYVPDPLADSRPYQYDRAAADMAFDGVYARESTHLSIGIFNKDEEIIGELLFKGIDREKGRCELGIALVNDAYKGLGLGGEAFRLATDYALGPLGLSSVYAHTMGGNTRMRRVLERLGYRLYLRTEGCYDMGGRFEDRLDYVLQK